jgi:hypothetical protein
MELLSNALSAISASKANPSMSGGTPTVSKRCPGRSTKRTRLPKRKRGTQSQAIGRSKGGMTTKILTLTDAEILGAPSKGEIGRLGSSLRSCHHCRQAVRTCSMFFWTSAGSDGCKLKVKKAQVISARDDTIRRGASSTQVRT